MITITYAEAALIAVSILLVLMIVAFLRNDARWCKEYRALQTHCRVEHQGWTLVTRGLMRGMAIPPPPPMPPARINPENGWPRPNNSPQPQQAETSHDADV